MTGDHGVKCNINDFIITGKDDTKHLSIGRIRTYSKLGQVPIFKKIRHHSVDQKFTVIVYGLHKTQEIKAVANEPHLLMCRNFVHSWGL